MVTKYRIHTLAKYLCWYRFVGGDPKWMFGTMYYPSMLYALEKTMSRRYDCARDRLHEDEEWYWRCEYQHPKGLGQVECVIVRQEDMEDPEAYYHTEPPESPYVDEIRDEAIFKALPGLKL